MDPVTPIRPSTYMRVAIALALLGISALLVTSLLHPAGSLPRIAPTGPAAAAAGSLGLLAVALATYAWVIFPPSGSVLMSAVVTTLLLWAWAARQASGLELVAFGGLVGVAIWHRRRRLRQFLRLQQVLDDLTEERTVKDQTIELARHARDALQKKLSRYAQLQTIAESLSNMTDPAAIAQLAVNRAFRLIGKSDVCLLFLVDPERQELSLFASEKRETIQTIRAKHGDQFDRYVLRTHAPLLVNDVRRDFRFTVTVSPERDVSSIIACPLLLGQSPAGVLRLDSAHPVAYTQDDLRFLDILLGLVATAMTNAKLFAKTQQLAMTDGLTGLMLRRPFLEQLGRELTRAGRNREPVAVMMLDVDHFKQYNDTFGHMAGDLILKGVAEVLRDAAPPGGMIVRYGGEEFVVVLPRVGRPDAIEVAERIRQRVAQRVHSYEGLGRQSVISVVASERRTPPPVCPPEAGSRGHQPDHGLPLGSPRTGGGVTVSLGVAAFPDDAQAELELIRIADQRLYQAKRAGRNRVVSS